MQIEFLGVALFPVVLEFIVKLSLHKTLKVYFSVQENIYFVSYLIQLQLKLERKLRKGTKIYE